jgi:UPF0755 protein
VRTRILILTAALVAAFVLFLLSPRASSTDTVRVLIPSGSGASAVGGILQRAGVIRWGPAFRWYATLTGNATALQAGEYELCPCASVPELVRSIVAGEALSTDIVVTIPEGMNIWEIDDVLAHEKLILPGLFARYYYQKEGTLFPDTYRFDRDIASHSADPTTLARVITPFTDNFKEKASGATKEQLIIASILEKEAKTADDMALVSGIIQKRMQLKMPLQIDATVAYGWCLRQWLPMSNNRTCDVTQAPIATEIKVDGAYNTYTRLGLPAGAISNPGLQALAAAQHPKTSDYLYYLSTRDGSKIIYAKTLAEHLKNRSKYLGL